MSEWPRPRWDSIPTRIIYIENSPTEIPLGYLLPTDLLVVP